MSYKFETCRKNISPKQFWNYVKREYAKRCGNDIRDVIDSFEDWATPAMPDDFIYKSIEEKVTEHTITKPLHFSSNRRVRNKEIYSYILEWNNNIGYAYFAYYED